MQSSAGRGFLINRSLCQIRETHSGLDPVSSKAFPMLSALRRDATSPKVAHNDRPGCTLFQCCRGSVFHGSCEKFGPQVLRRRHPRRCAQSYHSVTPVVCMCGEQWPAILQWFPTSYGAEDAEGSLSLGLMLVRLTTNDVTQSLGCGTCPAASAFRFQSQTPGPNDCQPLESDHHG